MFFIINDVAKIIKKEIAFKKNDIKNFSEKFCQKA